MKHEYYTKRRLGYIISIRCHHCNREWDLRFGWSAFLFALKVGMPFAFILIYLLFSIQFPNDKLAIAWALLVAFVARELPAYILCEYMRHTGTYEKFMKKD